MKALMRSYNSRANNQQGEKEMKFQAKNVHYSQAKIHKASKDTESMQVLTLQMKKVEDSNSDNDEDCNKSSSTYSSRDRHFLA